MTSERKIASWPAARLATQAGHLSTLGALAQLVIPGSGFCARVKGSNWFLRAMTVSRAVPVPAGDRYPGKSFCPSRMIRSVCRVFIGAEDIVEEFMRRIRHPHNFIGAL